MNGTILESKTVGRDFRRLENFRVAIPFIFRV